MLSTPKLHLSPVSCYDVTLLLKFVITPGTMNFSEETAFPTPNKDVHKMGIMQNCNKILFISYTRLINYYETLFLVIKGTVYIYRKNTTAWSIMCNISF
jgi:hypothetical protein